MLSAGLMDSACLTCSVFGPVLTLKFTLKCFGKIIFIDSYIWDIFKLLITGKVLGKTSFYAVIINDTIVGSSSCIANNLILIIISTDEDPSLRIESFAITDMNKPRSRIQWSKLKPPEMTNLEYQDGGQSAFLIHKQTSLF